MVSNRYYPLMPNKPVAIETQLAELALHLGRTAYGDCFSGGLTPAQWMALRFFARANRFSRTVSAFAEFHGTTKGTASQTVKSLEEKSYLKRTRCAHDGRSSLFSLTDSAQSLLHLDPVEVIVKATNQLTRSQCEQTADGLRQILGELARQRGSQQVGVCSFCHHISPEQADGRFQCRLMDESLDPDEIEQLCMRFGARSDPGGCVPG